MCRRHTGAATGRRRSSTGTRPGQVSAGRSPGNEPTVTVREAFDRTRLTDLRPTVAVWAACFRENNLLTYASAIALQLLVAVAALIFLAVALLRPLGAQGTWLHTVAPALASRLPVEWMGALNRIYGVDDERSMSRRFGISFGLALAVSALAIAAAFIGGGAFAVSVAELDLAERVVVPAAIVYVVVALLVIVAPARRQPW